jgi:hypothetical protein
VTTPLTAFPSDGYTARWRTWDHAHLETLVLRWENEGWTATGEVGREAVTYVVRLSATWQVRQFLLFRDLDQPDLWLGTDGAGRWGEVNGAHRPDLDGCTDIASPAPRSRTRSRSAGCSSTSATPPRSARPSSTSRRSAWCRSRSASGVCSRAGSSSPIGDVEGSGSTSTSSASSTTTPAATAAPEVGPHPARERPPASVGSGRQDASGSGPDIRKGGTA